MKIHGNVNLVQNELQNVVMTLDTAFPVSPRVGQLVFKDKILYICISIEGGTPVWVPLTKEITSYTHIQTTASNTWTFSHNLNTSDLSVTVYDTLNRVVIPGNVSIDSDSQVTVTFAAAVMGKVVLVAGQTDGNIRPDYAYEFYQTSPAATWTIAHGLNRYPVVRVFVGNAEVQPASIVFPDMNTVTITFNSPLTGQAKLI